MGETSRTSNCVTLQPDMMMYHFFCSGVATKRLSSALLVSSSAAAALPKSVTVVDLLHSGQYQLGEAQPPDR